MISTGIKGLDTILTGLRAGDNVVWQIDDIKDYVQLVEPFVQEALKEKKKVIYMRFAAHKELLKPSKQIKRYELNARAGFESFTTKINTIITQEGQDAYYVFDCLSELLSAWATDLMIGNFFMVTCPYLYELKTVTYFSLLRNNHSFKSIARIRETTQLLIDVYHSGGVFYIHPLKVWNRYSPTMFLPHQKKGAACIPVTDSVNAAKVLSYIHKKGIQNAQRNLDYWDRLFLAAEELLRKNGTQDKKQRMVKEFCGLMITKNKKILALAMRHFSLEELVEIKSRLIGTGFIGGKSVGMLLARQILAKNSALDWQSVTEPHDSFYIGSDIFYSYIVQNHWWKLRMQQKTENGYFSVAKILKEKMLYGVFSEEIMEDFQQIIEYFGTSPIIVRSSSLLEDGFGNAFAGKYESIFLANQGTPEQRYIQFAEAVKKIYASTMNEDALTYRKQRGLDKLDEQMALLVQRVSGSPHKQYFFPDIAGVGVSYNTYVWNDVMDPKVGMLRLVCGLGTRAVNRVEGDYPRMVALDNPLRRPYSERDDVKRYSQRAVDVINIKENNLSTVTFDSLIKERSYPHPERIATKDYDAMRMMDERGIQTEESWIPTFDNLFQDSLFAGYFKKIMESLKQVYQYPVEIEFTVNFTANNTFKINLLQCRPLQTRGLGSKVEIPSQINKDDIFFESNGYFLGGNISQKISWVVNVDPERYSLLNLQDKYEVARIVGKINRTIQNKEELPTLMIAPGRWGTTTPSLGVPVKFAEINNVTVLTEVASDKGNLMPELSFGTHFFQDLVETGIFFVALFPERKGVVFNNKWLKELKNLFVDLIPESPRFKDVIGVYGVGDRNLKIMSDVVSQKVVCFGSKKEFPKPEEKVLESAKRGS
ncbi:MAG TPA: PEP/pyruvate-binding domain-containing protein [Candidatus Omnitrophota bacterium]|nr:PEP/pyruvate-binding domain-containing protein [Candidatus Omnitrophota bacterium]HPT39086.1 PEP/pyruvate-binding domain-containing protein [Candidatus Omnitrophota bacterium]